MRKTKTNITDALLVKYLHNELGESEKNIVAYAITANRDVKQHFEQLQLVWNESSKAGVSSTVNVDEAWMRFKQRIGTGQKVSETISLQTHYKLLRVAALLLLLAGAGTIAYYKANDRNNQVQQLRYAATAPLLKTEATVNEDANKSRSLAAPTQGGNKKNNKDRNVKGAGVIAIKDKSTMDIIVANRTKEMVCNGTSSPMEICIIQKLKCKGGQSSIIATCSKLEPDESNRLLYKTMNDKTTGNCQAVVDEITIKKVATGETITLNADSKPVSASELFNYMTGQKKGDVFAGTFDSDCLAFDSRSGDFVLQQCAAGDKDNCN